MARMTPAHRRWAEFADRLGGPDGCDFHDSSWRCGHDHAASRRILIDMGFTDDDVDASLRYLAELGGACDCEVLFIVDAGEADGQVLDDDKLEAVRDNASP